MNLFSNQLMLTDIIFWRLLTNLRFIETSEATRTNLDIEVIVFFVANLSQLTNIDKELGFLYDLSRAICGSEIGQILDPQGYN